MELHPDFSDLLAAFVAAEVRFVLLGGYAVSLHGKPRATKDMDLLVSGSGDNPERVARALAAFGAPPNVVAAARAQSDTEVVYLGSPPVRVDILRTVDGLDTEQAIERAFVVDVGGIPVPIVTREDLIANKRASGRPQDLADVAMLESVAAHEAERRGD